MKLEKRRKRERFFLSFSSFFSFFFFFLWVFLRMQGKIRFQVLEMMSGQVSYPLGHTMWTSLFNLDIRLGEKETSLFSHSLSLSLFLCTWLVHNQRMRGNYSWISLGFPENLGGP